MLEESKYRKIREFLILATVPGYASATNVFLVRHNHYNEVGNDQVMEKIRDCITEWLGTSDGYNAKERASFDFNWGDLAVELEAIDFGEHIEVKLIDAPEIVWVFHDERL